MIEKILDRKQFVSLLDNNNFKALKNNKILITGASGSIGTRLYDRLGKICKQAPIRTDKDTMNVSNTFSIRLVLDKYQPDVIIHLAGMKYAPHGEVDPKEAIEININGTSNIINNLDILDHPCKVVLASTCKANNPEIVYGATKLIAERIVLNSGGGIARFFNVVETSGNVFEIWGNEEGGRKVSDCTRHFISLDEAVGLLMYTALADSGRYIVNSPCSHKMTDIYKRLYKEPYTVIPPRRGDRVNERFCSTSEQIETTLLNGSVLKLISAHD